MKLIALDVGAKRIGMAKADSKVRIAVPYGTVDVDGAELMQIASFARVYGTIFFVIGLPRNNQGKETAQSRAVRAFAARLKDFLPEAKIYFQDESLTSVEAEKRLLARHKGKPHYDKGEVDAEAATIILQDFLESFSSNPQVQADNVSPASSMTRPKAAKRRNQDLPRPTQDSDHPISQPSDRSQKRPHKLRRIILIGFFVFLIGTLAAAYWYYAESLKPVSVGLDCNAEKSAPDCQPQTFRIQPGESVQEVADHLKTANLIRDKFVFQIQFHLFYSGQSIKTGEFQLSKTTSLDDIIKQLIDGAKDNVFTLTILPGETIANIKKKLIQAGYLEQEIETAFKQSYDHPVLADKPQSVGLEGYIFGDTYEFYKDEAVENIIKTTLDRLYAVVQENDLINAYKTQKLSLFQGLTLASIVQKEAKQPTDQAKVAQVFYSRLAQNISLGSDVTAQYAADLVDPTRSVYTNNSAVLGIDSPYNTHKYAGLPKGPISNPGKSALLAAAHPAKTSYLFFLTGDDGTMYYSNTDVEHQRNISEHCKKLCNLLL